MALRSAPPAAGPPLASASEEGREAARAAGRLLQALRARPPLVHNITNWVAMDLSANLLLALGASPAMVHAEEEAQEFACLASSLVVNIGTFDRTWAPPAALAAAAAREAGRPWVLDPVAAGVTRFRSANAARLLAERPSALRANAAEVRAVASLPLPLPEAGGPGGASGPGRASGPSRGAAGTGGRGEGARGVDSLADITAAEPAARALASEHEMVVLATGEADFAADHERAFRVHGGSAELARVTATGCALSAALAAFLAAARDAGTAPLEAALAASLVFALASERAEAASSGPGSFRAAFLDAIAALSPDELGEAGSRLVPA